METIGDITTTPGSAPATTRASDNEREHRAALLADHAAQGRLSPEELSERLDRVFSARTRGELDALVQDLPDESGPAPRRAPNRRKRQELGAHVGSFVLVNALLIAVWALTGAGYFWPVWPLLGWGIGVASHASEALLGRSAPLLRPCARAGAGRR